MRTLRFEAEDNLFFRDGKPFTMGDESAADSIFPPTPLSLHGFLRYLYFSHHPEAIPLATLPNDPTRNLSLTDIRLVFQDQRVEEWDLNPEGVPSVPLPRDLVRKKGDNGPLSYLEMKRAADEFAASAYPHKGLLLTPDTLEGKLDELHGKTYLNLAELQNYVDGKPVGEFTDLKSYKSEDFKIGLERNADSRSAQEGMLYSTQFVRPEGNYNHAKGRRKRVEIEVTYTGLEAELPFEGRLGGENKMVRCKPTPSPPAMPAPDLKGLNQVKMYLATPAVFREGWQPAKLLEAFGLTLNCAALGRSQPIGGWNTKERQPRPMRLAVPAGSVYFLEGTAENIQAFVDRFHGHCLDASDLYSDAVEETFYLQRGFGKVFFARPTQEQLI